ncbi:MAG: P-loop NTPase [Bdellovibrionales bacterium]|nr:P-loop NTPase [Bdellovibrionales bacterium]
MKIVFQSRGGKLTAGNPGHGGPVPFAYGTADRSAGRALLEHFSGVRHIVAVASGKGGVGKSTVTMQLALSFCAAGKKVAVLDADPNGLSIARIAGLHEAGYSPAKAAVLVPRTEDGIGVVSLCGRARATFHQHRAPHRSDQSSEVHSDGSSKAASAIAELANAVGGAIWNDVDYLIVDLPPGPEPTYEFASCFGPRLNVVLVTIPSDVSGEVVLRSIAAVERAKARILGYVENMKGYLCPESGEIRPLFPTGHSVALRIAQLGEVPFEPMLAKLCDHGLTLESWTMLDCTSYLKEITDNIERVLEPGARIDITHN